MRPTMELRWVNGDPWKEMCIAGTEKYPKGDISGQQEPTTHKPFKLQQKWVEYPSRHDISDAIEEWRDIDMESQPCN